MEPRSTVINLIKGFIQLFQIKADELGYQIPVQSNYVPVKYASEYKIIAGGNIFNGVYQVVGTNTEIIQPTHFQNNSRIICADDTKISQGDTLYVCKKIN